MAEKGGYRHFMLKEMYEQPRAITDTFRGRVSLETGNVLLPDVNLDPATVQGHPARGVRGLRHGVLRLAARPLDDRAAGRPAGRDRPRLASSATATRIVGPETLVVAISQSGETADTLGRREGGAAEGLPDPGHHQRRGLGAVPRGHRHALHARRPRDRRGVDQGVLDDDRGQLPARPLARPAARSHQRRGPAQAHPRPGRDPAPGRADARARRQDRRARPPARRTRRTSSTSGAACSTRSRSRARSSSRSSPTSTPRATRAAR